MAVSLLAGRGMLRVLGLGLEGRAALFASPFITMVSWTLMVGTGVVAGFPIRRILFVGWAVTAVAALAGLRSQDVRTLIGQWRTAALVALLPAGVMAPYFLRDLTRYLGSHLADGWSYVAYGQYLWRYARGTEGGLEPLYQYAAHLNSTTRFAASSLLAFLSPLAARGDTQAVAGEFLAWTLFVFGATCVFFGIAAGLPDGRLWAYALLTGGSGWLLSLLWANNYDNAVAISFLPAFAGVARLIDPRRWRWGVVLGATSAATIYCYPEAAAIILAAGALFVIERALSTDGSRRDWVRLLACALLVSGLFVGPILGSLVHWIYTNARVAMAAIGLRPGEGLFTDLLSPRLLVSTFWGFGQDPFVEDPLIREILFQAGSVAGVVLSLMALLGIGALLRRRAVALVVVTVALVGCALFMVFRQAYGYGAYKFIVLAVWGLAFLALAGAEACGRVLGRRSPLAARALAGVGLTVFVALVALRVVAFDWAYPENSVTPFRAVREVRTVVGTDGVFVSVRGGLANMWAVYFLRDFNVRLGDYRGPMAQAHVVPFMERARHVDVERIDYVLSDDKDLLPGQPIWAQFPYYLWKLDGRDWVLVRDIETRNGVERWGNDLGFWLGRDDAQVDLVAARRGDAAFIALYLMGPSLPGNPQRLMRVWTDEGFTRVIAIRGNGEKLMCLPLIAGRNRIRFRALDTPTADRPSGDPRVLLIGLRRPRFELPKGQRSCRGDETVAAPDATAVR